MPILYSLIEVIEMAVKTEETGLTYYENTARETKSDALKADEEARHRSIFLNLYNRVKELPQTSSYNWEEASQYLKAITDSQFFLGKEKAIIMVKEAKTTTQALEYALQFEKETMLFYQEIRAFVNWRN